MDRETIAITARGHRGARTMAQSSNTTLQPRFIQASLMPPLGLSASNILLQTLNSKVQSSTAKTGD